MLREGWDVQNVTVVVGLRPYTAKANILPEQTIGRGTAEGDPIRISMCHCLACQRRTGSAFGMQARWTSDNVHIEGRSSEYVRTSDESDRDISFHFCPECGATVYYVCSDQPDLIAVPIGAFADPSFPPPTVSVWESRRHPWVAVPATEHHD
jgi:hypothetical protein